MWQMRRVATTLVTAAAGAGLMVSAFAFPTTVSALTPRADATAASGSASPAPTVSASATASPSASASDSATATVTPSATPTTPAPADTAAPAPVPTQGEAPSVSPDAPLPTELGSWCLALFPPGSGATERTRAQALLNGSAQMGQGGTYTLTEHPDWKPQAGTDTSGDRHVNSLFWALPLLYRGVHKQVRPMVDRFRQLMYYWVADHQGKRGYWVDGSIYGGLRTQTLLCAAQTLNDPYLRNAALRDASTMMGGWDRKGAAVIGSNNTDLIRQTGALGVYCWVGDTAHRDRAWGNVVGVARGIVQPDGSDVEGSPGYAVYDESLLSDAERAAATCGIPSTEVTTLKQSMYDFVANATQPDFQLTSLGDTVNQPLSTGFAVGDPRAEFIRSKGATGTPPAGIYSYYDGGYVFARAGWQPQPGGPDTFYSVRYASTRPPTAHTHDDGASLTVFSKGVEFIADPGPYHYENASALRGFMRSRAAHSSFTVSGVSHGSKSLVKKLVTTSDFAKGGNDLTCVRDSSWGSVTVVRCVTYVRSIDAIIVTDHVTAGKSAKARAITQRWQVPPGVSGEQTPTGFRLAKGDARLGIKNGGSNGWAVQTGKNGSSVGWFTQSWGEKVPGGVVSRKLPIPKSGIDRTMVTVLTPQNAGDSVPVDITAEAVTITRNGTAITTPLPKN